jgi:hypothetical protein
MIQGLILGLMTTIATVLHASVTPINVTEYSNTEVTWLNGTMCYLPNPDKREIHG